MRFRQPESVKAQAWLALCAAALVFSSCEPAEPAPAPSPVASPKSGADLLPNAPEKALVLEHCQTCHDLDWILRSGGTRMGWEDRLVRMIRAGATIPRDSIPAVAAYLAKALPPRPNPEADP